MIRREPTADDSALLLPPAELSPVQALEVLAGRLFAMADQPCRILELEDGGRAGELVVRTRRHADAQALLALMRPAAGGWLRSWLELRTVRPTPGDLVVLHAPKTADFMVVRWPRGFAEYGLFTHWYPLPSMPDAQEGEGHGAR